jgi:hypothetical protein
MELCLLSEEPVVWLTLLSIGMKAVIMVLSPETVSVSTIIRVRH